MKGTIPFNRPPRIQAPLPNEKVEIPAPSNPPPPPPRLSWFQLGLPLAGLLVVGALYGALYQNWLMVIPMLAMSAFSAAASIIGTVMQRKQRREEAEEREKQYAEILAQKQAELTHFREEQQHIRRDVDPDLPILLARAQNRDLRLWERRPTDHDFLCLRLGLGTLPSTVEVVPPHADWPSPQLQAAQTIADEFRFVPDVPITANLREHGPLGIAGALQLRTGIARSLICNLVTHHSPDEVHLLAIYSPARGQDWHWLKWLPHTYALHPQAGKRYLANDSLSASEVLTDLLDELHRRQNRLRAARQGGDVTETFPWLVLLVEDYAMVRRDPAINLLLTEGTRLNATAIFLVDQRHDVPTGCSSFVECQPNGEIKYSIAGPGGQVFTCRPEYADVAFAEQLGRNMAPLEVQTIRAESELPTSVRLLDLLNIQSLDQFDATQEWTQRPPSEYLKVPLGIRRGGQPLILDLSHTGHGPHGLVGGTTGSGKSELLQTLVVALALTHHPHEVGFVLVDFKGGGAFSTLRDLPHTLGLVTDLSGGLAERALVALRSELKRRELLLHQIGVSDIRDYQALKASEPLPRLVIIIDEFAQLAMEHPDFMTELIGVAQKGRSLGVHLILSTQRPAGAVNPNIWANAKFRICLRVESREDSQDMLRRPDAWNIPRDVPGRAYFQVGNDEVFELFQVARTAGRYQKKGDTQSLQQSIVIAQISPVGRRTILVDTGRTQKSSATSTSRTEAEVIVEKLQEAARRLGVQKLPSPWPEPLPEQVPLPELLKRLRYPGWNGKTWVTSISAIGGTLPVTGGVTCRRCGHSLGPTARFCPSCGAPVQAAGRFCKKCGRPLRPGARFCHHCGAPVRPSRPPSPGPQPLAPAECPWLGAVLGLLDDPAHQRQDPFVLNLPEQDGHLVVVGAPGSGMEMLLRTLVLSLARTHTPEELHFYFLEFGGQALSAFQALPHSGGIFAPADEERIRRLFRRLLSELDDRKQKCTMAHVDSLARYRELHPDRSPPAIVVVLTGFAAFRQAYDTEMVNFTRLVREGGPYGIHLVLAINRPGDVPMNISAVIARWLALRLADPADYGQVLGTYPTSARGKVPVGRGWYGRPPLEFQAASPVQAADERAQLAALQHIVGKMDQAWRGSRPRPIEVLREVIPLQEVMTAYESIAPTIPPGLVAPLGLNYRDMRPAVVDMLQDGPYFLVVAPARGGKTTALMTWTLALAGLCSPQEVQFVLVGLRRGSLRSLADLPHVLAHCEDSKQAGEVIERLERELDRRHTAQVHEPLVLIVADDYGHLASALSSDMAVKSRLERLAREGRDAGFGFLVAGRADEMAGFDALGLLKLMKVGKSGLLLKEVDPHSNPLGVRISPKAMPADMPVGRGFLVRSGVEELIQVATPESAGRSVAEWVQEIISCWEQARVERAVWQVEIAQDGDTETREAVP